MGILSNLFIAAAAFLFCLSGQMLLAGHVVSWPLCIHVFFATWTVYQLSRWRYHRRYDKAKQVQDNLYFWLEAHPVFTKYSILLGMGGALIPLAFMQPQTWLLLAIAGVVSFLYSMPRGLRFLPYVKIFWIALIWSLTGTWLPAAEIGMSLTEAPVVRMFIFRFIYIVFITLPFDMCDIRADMITNTRTIPVWAGFENSKKIVALLGIVLLGIVGFNLFSFHLLNIPQSIAAAAIFMALVGKTYLLTPDYPKWKIMLVYDGSIIVYSLLLIVLS